MPRAPHTRVPDPRPETALPAPAPAAPAAPAQVLWLQRAAGNQAVAAQLARQPAPTGLPDKAPSSAPPVAGRSRVIGAPPPTRGVETGEDGPRPGVDLASGTDTVTLTFLIRDLHLKDRDPATIDWLHEPGVEIEATRGRIPKPVLTAAISARARQAVAAAAAGGAHQDAPQRRGREARDGRPLARPAARRRDRRLDADARAGASTADMGAPD